MVHPLQKFIAHAREKGMDHATIRMLLLSSGWKEREIAEALTSQSLDIPVPVPPDVGGARDAFFHLLSFSSLYACVISLVILYFTYINRLFPDPAVTRFLSEDNDFASIRWSIACLVIAFPLFGFMHQRILQDISITPEKANSGIHRWLTYLTLFVTALVMMGDGVTLLYSLLQGELTVRFFLKVLVVFLLTALPFTYYFISLRTPTVHQ